MEIQEYKAPRSHESLMRMVTDFLAATQSNSLLQKRDRDYFDGDQLSPAVRDMLRKRGQPPVVDNKIFPAISGVLGILDAGESDPEAFPRTQSAQDAADVATKTLRYVADRANYKRVRKSTSENFCIEGIGAAIVEWDGRNITVSRIRWDEFIYDPYSREHDFIDAKWAGVAKLMDAEDVEAMFPDTYDSADSHGTDAGLFNDDENKKNWWGSDKRKQVRVIDIYYEVAGEWHRAVFTRSTMLYSGPSEYLDDYGDTTCPIAAVSYEVSRGGDRYGPIRNMVPLQDEVNNRRSRLLQLTNQRQVRQTDPYMGGENKELARQEAARADGAIPFGWETASAPDLVQGNMGLLQQSNESINRMAPTPAVLGRVSSSNESGRARQILQQAGYTELARYFGRFEAFELALFRRMWLTARQYLDTPTMIRIVDDPRAPQFMQINEPVLGPVAQPIMNPETGEPMVNEYGQPMIETTIAVVEMRNRLAAMDMDIVLATVPDTITLEQEVFKTLAETQQSTGVSVFDPQFLAIIEMSPLPNKRAVIERIQRLAADAQKQGSEAQAAMAQQAMAAAQADVEATQAKAARDGALAQKAMAEAQFTGWPSPNAQPFNS